MKLKDRFFTTYSKIMLSQYDPVKNIVQKHTPGISEEKIEDQTLLSSEQLNEALNGPYGRFINLILPAYAGFNKLVSSINLTQDTLFKTKRVNIAAEVDLPKQLKNFPLNKMTALEKKLQQYINEYHDIWETLLQEWNEHLLKSIASIDFAVSEIEQREFTLEETVSQILNQFTDFRIDMPAVNLESLTFHEYLVLKIHLMIHNSLGRRQLSIKRSKEKARRTDHRLHLLDKTQTIDFLH
jgi:hypothetical protein